MNEKAFWRGFLKAAADTLAPSIPKVFPSYTTNLVNSYKQQFNPTLDTDKFIGNNVKYSPSDVNHYNTKTDSINLTSNSDTWQNATSFAHELGHKAMQEPTATSPDLSKLPEHLNFPAIKDELVASLNARRLLGTNYTANEHELLAKSLSTYILNANKEFFPQNPTITRHLNEQINSPAFNQTTNALRGLEGWQANASKLLNDYYKR